MKRIVIIGNSGCGKTTLANKLGSILKINCIDLDDYYWLSNWQPRDLEEFYIIVDKLTQNQTWIISGNYSKVRDLIWSKCDLII
jgi:adenylate kinase family enzyme